MLINVKKCLDMGLNNPNQGAFFVHYFILRRFFVTPHFVLKGHNILLGKSTDIAWSGNNRRCYISGLKCLYLIKNRNIRKQKSEAEIYVVSVD